MTLPRLILASASPRRADLLRELGVEFEVLPGQAEELQPDYLTPREICQINAHRKARSIARKQPDSLVLGADTIVCLEDVIFGKPAGFAEAEEMLLKLQGQTHRVITGVCLLQARFHRQRCFAVTTMVTFRQLNLAQIRSYFAKVDPLDKAGAYGIQERGDELVASINGSFSNVVGLPLERLREELERW